MPAGGVASGEVAGDPQHVRLAATFQKRARTSAAAVHLIAAEETVRVAYAMLAWSE
ncbi:hypothetical protein Mame01_30250 [Microbispora amethystogenes]|nr:hypothetical protein Mame01_30250 [Microbispora amethystogenes]